MLKPEELFSLPINERMNYCKEKGYMYLGNGKTMLLEEYNRAIQVYESIKYGEEIV